MAALAATTLAQDNSSLEQGLKPFGSFHGGDIDSVSLTNGNLTIHAPLISFPQRGGKLRLNFVLLSNSKGWYVKTTMINGQPYAQWYYSGGGTTITDDQTIGGKGQLIKVQTDPGGGYVYVHVSWLVTADGAAHQIGGPDAAGSSHTLDATAFMLNGGATTTRDGVRYFTVTDPNFGHSYREDPNGNQITYLNSSTTGAINLTDTMGRVIPLAQITMLYLNGSASGNYIVPGAVTTDFTGCPAGTTNAVLWNAPAVNGGPAPYKFCYATYTANTAFGVSSIAENNFTQANLINAIVLPNQTKWQFTYDSYFDVTSVTLPTGGTISYTYVNLGGGSPYVSSRTVNANDGTGPHTWTYSWNALGSGTVVVTDPLSNDVVHYIASLNRSPYENQTKYFQGSYSTGTLLKTVQMQYSWSVNPYGYYTGNDTAINVVQTSATTIWPSGLQSQTASTYDPQTNAYSFFDPLEFNTQPTTFLYGSLVSQADFDYGSAGPGSLLRKTVNTYLWQTNSTYQNLNLIAPVASTIACSPLQSGESADTGNPCQDTTLKRRAETDYAYDQFSLDPSSVATQHDGAPANGATRANLTSVTRWLNTGTSPVASNHYFDTGEVHLATDPGGHTTTYTYDTTGTYPIQIQYPATGTVAHQVSFGYDFNTGLKTSSTDQNGNQTTYSYDLSERITGTTLPDGGQVTWSYNDTAPMSVTATDKITSTMSQSATAQVDGVGRVFKTTSTNPDCGTGLTEVDTTYDAAGHKATVSNPFCSTSDPTYGITSYQYDGLGRVTMLIPPDGTATANRVTTDYAANVTTVTDQAGHARRSTSDALGRLVEVDEPGGSAVATAGTGTVSVSGTEQSHSTTTGITSGSGSVTISGVEQSSSPEICNDFLPPTCSPGPTIWDSGLVSITVNGFSETVGYDQNSTAASIASALVSLFNGDSTSPVTASLSGSTVNLFAKATGAASNYTLTASSQTSDATDFGTSSFTATASGATLTGGSNGTTTTTYDTGTVSVTVGGFTASAGYGQSSTPTTLAGALAQTFNTGAGSPVTAAVSGSSLNLTSRALGAASNYSVSVSSATSQPGTYAQPSFTASGPAALTGGSDSITLPYPYVTLYTYDGLGNLTCVEQHGAVAGTGCSADPSNDASSAWRVRRSSYDSLSRLLSAKNPESGTVSWTYDNDSNVASKTDARGITITYGPYDALHRVTGKTYSNGDAAVGYSYDNLNGCAAPNNNPIGQQTGMTDASGSTTWCFDRMGRAGSEQRSINIAGLTPGAVTKTITYTYNLDGSVAAVGYPSGRTISYNYNTAGRATWAKDLTNSINYVTGATYAPQGALAGAVYGNSNTFAGIVTSNQYNNRLQPRVLSAVAGSQSVLNLSYDFLLGTADNGTIAKIVNNRDNNRSQNFTYDGMNRLQAAWTDGPNWGDSYVIDPWGNLTNKNQMNGKTGGEGSLNQGAAVTNRFLGMSYDLSGNLLFDGNNYTYDAENRIKTAAGVTYTYDGNGDRVAKSNGTLYWGGSSKDALAESGADGTLTSEYVFFNGKRCARRVVATGAVFYYFSDHLGSSNVITDAGGVRQAESDFYPYGGESVVLADATSNHYKFTGKERDTETGVDYFFARYYSSNLGRFLTPDWSATPTVVPYAQFGDPQSLNLYGYVGNNPVLHFDLDGHCWPPSACAEKLMAKVNQIQQKIETRSVASGNRAAAVIGTYYSGVARDVVNGVASLATVGKATGAALDSGNSTQKAIAISQDLGKAGAIAIIGAGVGGGLANSSAAATSESSTSLSTFRFTSSGETFTHYGFAQDAGSFANGLRPGGFATTESGLTGAQAQSGLSLPHAAAPDAAYTITPAEGTPINVNPVTAPANGQPGGLPEVQFPMGTGPGTVSGPSTVKPQ